jgi:phosphoribosylglycinamide formyltransferase-1
MSQLLARAPCTPADPLRVGVLVSGSGSNLQAILDRAAWETSLISVRVVIATVPGVHALERAREANVAAVTVPSQGRPREQFEDEVAAALAQHHVEFVALAGFMRVLTPHLLSRYPRRVVNVHPALLPSFPGLHAARQALAAGVKLTGCTVHLVDAGVDTGPILAQAAVPVYPGDDENKLQARIQENEHRLFPEVLEAIARGDL